MKKRGGFLLKFVPEMGCLHTQAAHFFIQKVLRIMWCGKKKEEQYAGFAPHNPF